MSQNKPSTRLPAYTKVTVSSLAAASAVGTTEAAIVFFDVNPDKTINATPFGSNFASFGSINLGTGTYTLNSTAGTYMFFAVNETTWWQEPRIQTAGTSSGYYAYNLSYGSPINGTALTGWGTMGTGLGYWSGGGSGYIGLRIDNGGGNYNYGWAQLSYVDAGAASTLTVSGFAFEDQLNTAILAGDQGGPAAVPEPGTMAVGAGLFALAVGAHLRRRREKKAAAPDALLNLAAGARGVEKFRADKAA